MEAEGAESSGRNRTFIRSIYMPHIEARYKGKREKERKKTSISLSLSLFEYTTYTAMYYIQLHIEEKNTSL